MIRRRRVSLTAAVATLLAGVGIGAGAGPAAAASGPSVRARTTAAVKEIPVSFTVRNTNTSRIPCAADGKAYTVKGHLVGPAARLDAGTRQAVALYVHGLGYGEFFWNYKGVPGYDYADQQAAKFGLVSVTIDRLGYGASGKPDGNQVCYGSEADYLNQIVTQLRSGDYTAGGGPARLGFERVALVGHSAGGFMVENAASSYQDVDALITAGFSNTGISPLGLVTFARTTIDCYTGALPKHYAFFGKTAADFRRAHFFNADPAVEQDVGRIRAPDPCMDIGSSPQTIGIDALTNASSIKVPTLLINGANDKLFPPPAGDEEKLLFGGNRDLTQVTLPATGHAVTLGRTAPQFRDLVGNWLVKHGF